MVDALTEVYEAVVINMSVIALSAELEIVPLPRGILGSDFMLADVCLAVDILLVINFEMILISSYALKYWSGLMVFDGVEVIILRCKKYILNLFSISSASFSFLFSFF